MLTLRSTRYKQNAVLVVTLYLFSAYGLPFLILSIFGWENPKYIPVEVTPIQWLAPIFAWLGAITVFYVLPPLRRTYQIKRGAALRSQLAIAILVFLNAFLLFFVLSGLTGYRYGNQHIADSSLLLIVLYLCSRIMLDFFILSYVYLPALFFSEKRRLLPLILLISALFLSTSGLASILFAIIASTMLVISKYANNLIFVDLGRSLRNALSALARLRVHRSWGLFAVLLPILLTAVVGGWLYGNAVKMGISPLQVIGWTQTRFPHPLDALQYVIFRHSPDYYSLRFALAHYAFQNDFSVIDSNFLEPFRTAIFRLDLLAGRPFDVPRPEWGSLSRINLINIANYTYRLREGTSPGPMAGFLYCFPFPFNFMFLSAYLLLILTFFERVFKAIGQRINLLGLLFFAYAMRIFFMSPLDIFSVFNTTLIYLGGFVVIFILFVEPSRRQPYRESTEW